jgi:thioesterase domain-containing protein
MARIRSQTTVKMDFKLRDLIQRPTIVSLLGLDKQSSADTRGLLLLNQPCRNERVKPLFCIHAGFGTVFDYQPIAQQLQGLQTVYGIPCRMLADSSYRDVSLSQMAEDYCRMIRDVQPEGPYHLLGWSLGGTLVAMMTALLEADGQTVEFLGLIDPYVPGMESSQLSDWQQDFLDYISIVIPGITYSEDIKEKLQDHALETISKQTIANLLQEMLAMHKVTEQTDKNIKSESYIAMDSEELAHIFLVARHLKALSLQVTTLDKLETQTICWWAAAREKVEQSALERQIHPSKVEFIKIAAAHFDIVRDERLLSGISSLLPHPLCESPEKLINE